MNPKAFYYKVELSSNFNKVGIIFNLLSLQLNFEIIN